VRPEPIEYHHLTLAKRGRQEVLDVGFEGIRVGGSFYAQGGAHGSLESDGSDERVVFLP
jgi:hypothetical protein